jgi:hypothetical protein
MPSLPLTVSSSTTVAAALSLVFKKVSDSFNLNRESVRRTIPVIKQAVYHIAEEFTKPNDNYLPGQLKDSPHLEAP